MNSLIFSRFNFDQLSTQATPDTLDKLRFRDVLQDVYELDYPETEADRISATRFWRPTSPRASALSRLGFRRSARTAELAGDRLDRRP